MGIFQSNKVVFYHPLNDKTEYTETQNWTESTPMYPTGKVSDALGPAAGDSIGSFGAEAEFLGADGATYVSIAALDSPRFVVAYRDGADNGNGTAKIGSVSGTTVTFGAETEFRTGSVTYISVDTLDSSKFVVAYRDDVDSNHGTAKVGTVSGADITFGTEKDFLAANYVSHISVTVLDSSKFVVAYQDGADSSHGTAKVGTVSGADITFGAEAEFDTGGIYSCSTSTLDSSNFVVTYRNEWNHGVAKIGMISGVSITFGSSVEFLAADGGGIVSSVAALSSTGFVVVYRDGADGNHGTSKVGTVFGADITFGAEAKFNAGDSERPTAAAISSSRFVVVYRDNADGNHGTSKVGTVSGTAITFGAEEEFSGVDIETPVAAVLGSACAVAYVDKSDANHGTAKISELSAAASLTASDGAAYLAAAGETKVAFCGWFQKPSG